MRRLVLLLLVSTATADDVEFLLQGVSDVEIPGVPGLLSVYGPRAFVVLAAPAGGGPGPIAAAARHGEGRIVVFGHNFFGQTLRHEGNARLALNVFAWAGRGTRVGVRRNRHLAELLKATSLDGPDWLAKLGACDAAYVPVSRLTSAEVEAVARYVRAGGGIVTGIPGWGWQQLNPRKSLAHDCPTNALTMRMGIALGRGTMKVPRDKRLGVARPPAAAHAGIALDELSARRKSELAVTTLTRCVADLPADDRTILPRLLPLEKRAVELPVGPTLDKVALMLQLRRGTPTAPHGTAAVFPGAVPADAPRVTRTVEIDLSVPRWHSTGLYAAPGETLSVATKARGLRIRIGCHTDKLWNKKTWKRAPAVTREVEAPGPAACAFGGLVYVVVPGGQTGTAAVTIKGAVEAPLYVLGKTKDWDRVRARPGPWAELATGKVVITVPSRHVRTLDDPEKLMRFWDRVMDACADLASRPRERARPERYVADVQISAGYMHAGYPIMTHLDAAPRFVNLERLSTKGDWGMFHEMGHNHQHRDWTFSGTVEVTCNLFTMYVLETVVGSARGHKGVSDESTKNWIARYEAAGKPFAMWKGSPFLALVMYRQLKDAFGWETYRKVFAEYRALDAAARPRNDAEKRDQWMVRFSKAVGRDLGPFFAWWNVPVSEQARRSIAHLPKWMPE